RPWETRAQATPGGGEKFCASLTTATAPAATAASMKRFPSLVSPRMATNKHPGLRRRESYSTAVTSASPDSDTTSAPLRTSWKVIDYRNYKGIPNAYRSKRTATCDPAAT